MKKVAMELGYPFPYLFDETQEVARAYQASCTPDFYIFNREFRCVYRGQLDDSRPGNGIPVTGESVRSALDSRNSHCPTKTEHRLQHQVEKTTLRKKQSR
jgi:hypothetical protein